MGDHSSRRRTCSAAPATNPGGEPERGPCATPIRSCSRWGLPCRPLLPEAAVRSCRTLSPLPGPKPRRYAFCGTVPDRSRSRPAGRYPAPWFRGARTFLASLESEPRPPDPLAQSAYGLLRAAAATARAAWRGIRRRSCRRCRSGRKRRWKAIDRLLRLASRHSRSARARAGSRRRSSNGSIRSRVGLGRARRRLASASHGNSSPGSCLRAGATSEWPTTLPRADAVALLDRRRPAGSARRSARRETADSRIRGPD